MTPTTCASWISGADVPQSLLVAAAQSWEDTQTASAYIHQALAEPDVELDVLVSAYRYFFYKNDDPRALEMAALICDHIHKNEHWPDAWSDLQPILQERLDDPNARLYLSAYTASGLVLARLGRLEEVQVIGERVLQIEAKEFGAEVLFSILNPSEED
ncbi:hypothetical protein [Acaryochloris sp. IP29b_bin.137]|uniref:hypothetical protein n=1 Tax=Acaryochloris sp. IP29b_bin.137 TaxID=2969217 RepID=UPI0026228E48|nr:hypothetical protein [Acaryochloris sp. IP29b_bin.137]